MNEFSVFTAFYKNNKIEASFCHPKKPFLQNAFSQPQTEHMQFHSHIKPKPRQQPACQYHTFPPKYHNPRQPTLSLRPTTTGNKSHSSKSPLTVFHFNFHFIFFCPLKKGNNEYPSQMNCIQRPVEAPQHAIQTNNPSSKNRDNQVPVGRVHSHHKLSTSLSWHEVSITVRQSRLEQFSNSLISTDPR